eukprot:Amastigsp_a360796_3.p2 type:complete len:139 gc:universal Amastigsp_a360796_3:463-47(-)
MRETKRESGTTKVVHAHKLAAAEHGDARACRHAVRVRARVEPIHARSVVQPVREHTGARRVRHDNPVIFDDCGLERKQRRSQRQSNTVVVVALRACAAAESDGDGEMKVQVLVAETESRELTVGGPDKELRPARKRAE